MERWPLSHDIMCKYLRIHWECDVQVFMKDSFAANVHCLVRVFTLLNLNRSVL